jgi:hypothetical protein
MDEPTIPGGQEPPQGRDFLAFLLHRTPLAIATLLVGICGVYVAVKANQETVQKTKRQFGMKFELRFERNCLEGAMFGIEIVNEGERPLTVTSVNLIGNELHPVVELPEVRMLTQHSKRALVEASPLPRTLQDGQVVEVKYPMFLLFSARRDLWPDIAEAEDADGDGKLLNIHRELEEFARVLREEKASHTRQTCVV